MDRKWIDISQALSNDIAVWPGDTPFSFGLSVTKEQSTSVNIGKLTTSVHTGTHVDAPFHFDQTGKKIDEIDIGVYIGKAKVLDVTTFKTIDRDVLTSFELEGVERLLLRMLPNRDIRKFPEEYPVLHVDVAGYLQEKGVRLIGVDTPSVDPLDSKTLDAHHALAIEGIHILENIVLEHVAPGDYELIALPLKIKGADGSPVRAVIRPLA
ncbi:arylformamidase [Virgibacillus soli]|uniref:Kynurenine formamidase n=1 Tax=Paracerasibacillus soli TaxID=480284 RepID=A0ABU5CRW8_9BACI|nr:arylformamidase [Virgibacillus soli]MDY0409112.1 arylformamidase [Virgibacillus soli]